MPFTHLHVTPDAGAARGGQVSGLLPESCAGAAFADGASAAAWTERDGLYRAVQHITACLETGLSPIVGVELAVLAEPEEAPPGGRRPRRGSAGEAGRVVVLAHGRNSAAGWGALCRLVSDAHAHTSGRASSAVPVGVLRSELAARCLDPETGRPVLTVLLGPDSDVGRAMAGRRFLRPRTLFREWLEAMPAGVLAVELVTHLSPPEPALSTSHAVRMLRLAAEHGVPAVLTAGAAGPDRLAPADAMHAMGAEIIEAAGLGGGDLVNLLSNTERIADRCRLEPGSDLSWDQPSAPQRDAHHAVDRAAEAIRGMGVRCAVDHLGLSIEVEDHELGRVHRALVAHFGTERAALGAMWEASLPEGTDPHALGSRGVLDAQAELPSSLATAPEVRPTHALRPRGLILGDERLRDRAPVQPSGTGVPMVQIDGPAAAHLGLVRVDVRGSSEQSAIALAVREIARLHGPDAVPVNPDEHTAWLASEHPEALLAGTLEHPGPNTAEPPAVRAARLNVPLLPVDIAASGASYCLERIESGPDAGRIGIRTPLTAVGGLSRREAARIMAARPYASVADARDRAELTPGAIRRLVAAGAFASLHRSVAAARSPAAVAADIATLARRPLGRAAGPITGQLAFGECPDPPPVV